MIYKQLYERLTDNVSANGRLIVKQAKSDINEWQKSHCLHPFKHFIYDSHTGQKREVLLPCGNCWHCVETKKNEWVTRLYAHAESYSYIYFVTLTYRSFEKFKNPYQLYLVKYLDAAYWHYDNKNYTGRFCYRPCVLVKKHYQDFLKRLRKNTKNDTLSYFGCGEYGHNYGAPHFHFLLFSNQPIYLRDIQRAWGCYLSKNKEGSISPSTNNSNNNKSFISFGNVDFHDLVINGTFTTNKLLIENQNLSPEMCFSYVAKYVGKNNDYNQSRVKLLFNKLQIHNYDNFETLTRCEDVSSRSDYRLFIREHAPFIAVSRGTPIGSIFVKKHIKSMVNGVFPRPSLSNGKSLIVPNYFRRKAAEYIYGLRSISAAGCISKGCLLSNLGLFAQNTSRCVDSLLSSTISKAIKTTASYPVLSPRALSNKSINELCTSQFAFVDLVRKCRYLLVYRNNTIEVEEFYYSRPLKSYVLKAILDFSSWCGYYFTSLSKDFLKYLSTIPDIESTQKYIKLLGEFYKEHNLIEFVNSLGTSQENQIQIHQQICNANRFYQSKF